MDELRIGMMGLGTVGRGVARLLTANAEELAQRAGVRLRLVRVATREPERNREVVPEGAEITTDLERVVYADDVDIAVELIGGLDPAKRLVEAAIASGKSVVTANKALLAAHGNELLPLAEAAGVELGFEAAVAGAVPVIKALRESLAANRIELVFGILNGTCNYILTEMRQKGLPFEQVLRAAQEQGYAEADPAFDVDGIDAAHKLAILSALAFGTPIDFSGIHIDGIRHVSEIDIAWATEMGYRIKLLGIAKRGPGGLELRVQPTMVPAGSMIAAVEGVFNAVMVKGDYCGSLMFYGRGAGEMPTASAVVGDLVDIARNRMAGGRTPRVAALSLPCSRLAPLPLRGMEELVSEYYLRLAVEDRPGVLAEITAILRKHEISIDAIHQKGRSPVAAVPLVIVTHETSEQRIQASLGEMAVLACVRETPRLIRIENVPA